MKAFAIWYLEWGWLITMAIGLPVGHYAGQSGRDWILYTYFLAVFFFGLICLHFKYS